MSSHTRAKKLDEKRSQEVRELAARAENKHCVECHQRGPTYADMTTGSFVCTTCSGLLRGLNPPHRVKSISMATFTVEDVNLLKEKGNDHCRAVWLGLYDGQDPRPDDQGMKDFLITKYERKRWYVSEREIQRQNKVFEQASSVRRHQQAPTIAASDSRLNNQQSSNQLLDLFSDSPVKQTIPTTSVAYFPTQFDQPLPPPQDDRKTSVSSIPSMVVGASTKSANKNIPYTKQQQPIDNFAGFADFDSAFADATSTTNNASTFDAAVSPKVKSDSGHTANQFHSGLIQPTRASNFATPSTLLDSDIPLAPSHVNGQRSVTTIAETPTPADKYAALADLDSMFSSASVNDSTVPATRSAFDDTHLFQNTQQPSGIFGSKPLSQHDSIVKSGEINWGNSIAPTRNETHVNNNAFQATQMYKQQAVPLSKPFGQQQPSTMPMPVVPPSQHQQQHPISSPNWNPFL